jgi:PhzF family phenazine biosynthesis protein
LGVGIFSDKGQTVASKMIRERVLAKTARSFLQIEHIIVIKITLHLEFAIFDVFASRPFTGNQAAVVCSPKRLISDSELLKLASEFLLPETVALETSSSSRCLSLRFASAERLVPRCGHGALAGIAHWVIANGGLGQSSIVGEYKVGRSKAAWYVNRKADQKLNVSVEWPDKPYNDGQLTSQDFSEVFGLSSRDLDLSLPLCIYNSGNRNALIPIKSAKVLYRIKPDWHQLELLCKRKRLMDCHIYCLERGSFKGSAVSIRSRNFFPFGVKEESATGTASVSLAAAFVDSFQSEFAKSRHITFEFKQGAKRRARLRVRCRQYQRTLQFWLEGGVICVAKGKVLQENRRRIYG